MQNGHWWTLQRIRYLWSEAGATNVLNLRCALYGNQFDQVWDQLNQSNYLRLRIIDRLEEAGQVA